jgi:hypothetical protein
MTADAFRDASETVSDPATDIADLARPFVGLLRVSGASVSTFGPFLDARTISATDERAGRIDELQFDLGEGPCWDALTTRRPVIEPDLAGSTAWPVFAEAVREQRVGAIFAFPLVLGPLELGAVDLYSDSPTSLDVEQQRQALALSSIVSRILLRHVVSGAQPVTGTFSRRLVHQATGMVLAQLETAPEDAYLVIQGRAFAENRSMRDVAEDIIERRIRFSTRPEEETQ